MTFFVLYLIAVLISFFYIKIDWRAKEKGNQKNIIILSGKNEYITKFRIKEAITQAERNDQIVICGKEMSKFMKSELKKANIKNILIQDKSTNTYEDVEYLVKMSPNLKNEKIILISSLAHQRRAFNTFLKFFNKEKIINKPALGEFLSWHSPLLPIGWLATLLNFFKDYSYNKKS